MLVLSKNAEPTLLEQSTEQLQGQLASLRERVFEIRGQSTTLDETLTEKQQLLAEQKSKLTRLEGDLASVSSQLAASSQDATVGEIIEKRLQEAKQSLTEEMRRLQAGQSRQQTKSNAIGGIPVDSEYIIFIIDTSGSMFNNSWPLVLKKLDETLSIYPRVKGIQVMSDMGEYMFSQYRRKWIPDSSARRRAIIQRLASWHPFSNSSPVEGITAAIETFYAADKKISLYVFGDDFSGGSIESVLKTVDRLNQTQADGSRRVRIHAVGFPVQFAQAPQLQIGGIRFATLMRALAEQNDGTFVGLNSFRR